MLAGLQGLLAHLRGHYAVYSSALVRQCPLVPELLSSVKGWGSSHHLSRLDPSTGLIVSVLAVMVLFVLFRQATRYTRVLVSLLVGCVQLLAFALMLLALLLYRDSINDFAKETAARLGL